MCTPMLSEMRNLVNDLRCDRYLKDEFDRRPILPSGKNHGFVRTVNDVAKQMVATLIPI